MFYDKRKYLDNQKLTFNIKSWVLSKLNCISYLFCLQRPLEQPQKWCKTEAIHVVQLGKVADDKEQTTAIFRKWKVRIPILKYQIIDKHEVCILVIDCKLSALNCNYFITWPLAMIWTFHPHKIHYIQSSPV